MVPVQSCCFANKTYCFFWRARHRSRRWILKSLLGSFTESFSCSDGKEMYKKAWYTCDTREELLFSLILPSTSSLLKVPDRGIPDRTCRIAGYIPCVRLNLILAYLFREEVNKDEPGLFYWIYMFFFWSQCISTVVLAVLIAAKRNEDGPIFVVKVRPA